MSNVEGQEYSAKLSSQERLSLSAAIQDAMAHPVPQIDFMMAHIEGNFMRPENRVIIENVSDERIQEFFALLRMELTTKRQEGTAFHYDIEDWLDGTEEEQSLAEHEMAHIHKAKEVGVDLLHSSLAVTFLYSNTWGIMWTFEFVMPDDTSPFMRAVVAMAPDEPSSPDIHTFRHYVQMVEDPDRKEQLIKLYEEKMQKPFDTTG